MHVLVGLSITTCFFCSLCCLKGYFEKGSFFFVTVVCIYVLVVVFVFLRFSLLAFTFPKDISRAYPVLFEVHFATLRFLLCLIAPDLRCCRCWLSEQLEWCPVTVWCYYCMYTVGYLPCCFYLIFKTRVSEFLWREAE